MRARAMSQQTLVNSKESFINHITVMMFGTSVFVSSALLFSVQPIVARFLLPLLGGAPAVWNVCVLFFQSVLLIAYFYVLVIERFSLPIQVLLQLLLLLLGLAAFPLRILPSWANSVPTDSNPTFWLISTLLTLVGVPVFVVSGNGTLMQKWFSKSRSTSSGDPYFLYAVSNAGSLLALLSYPTFLERYFSLKRQADFWATSYALLVVLVLSCALILSLQRRKSRNQNSSLWTDKIDDLEDKRGSGDERTSARERLRWMWLAFLPSALMLGVTTYISTDIASVPLLWIAPLSLYLLTLVISFSVRTGLPFRITTPILKIASLVLS